MRGTKFIFLYLFFRELYNFKRKPSGKVDKDENCARQRNREKRAEYPLEQGKHHLP